MKASQTPLIQQRERPLLPPWSRAAAAAIALAASSLNLGCLGGSGGGGVIEGAATIRGVVASYEDGGGENVEVSVAGTDLASTTADDGFFVLSGVPPGDQSVVFARGGTDGRLNVAVPPDSVVELQNVRVRDGNATAESIRVEQSAAAGREDDDSLDEDSRDDDSDDGAAGSGSGGGSASDDDSADDGPDDDGDDDSLDD